MNKQTRMPVLFTAHGSPLNAVGDNPYRKGWKHMGEELGMPKAIVMVSAHWRSHHLYVRRAEDNPQILDIYGFPKAVTDIKYEPPGSIEVADRVLELLDGMAVVNNQWGLDHGIWTVMSNMYPQANIPIVPISCNVGENAEYQFQVGEKLRPLRDEGILIVCSGNIVRNVDLAVGPEDRKNAHGFEWAINFDAAIKEAILTGDFQTAVHYEKLPGAVRSVTGEGDHFYPLLTALGAADPEQDQVTVWNHDLTLGSISMTSYLFTSKEK